ncbi:MAG: DUF5009 domain-containing protein [Balneola sp.]
MHSSANRLESIDLLRALAILGMILSGYIAYGGVMPAWMYHAQVPPPSHTFNPSLPGLTWVDLVFPMFLFTMGIAFPFSLRKRLEGSGTIKPVVQKLIVRFLLLAYFAIYFQHIKPYALAPSPQLLEWGISLIGFFLLIGAFGGYSKYLKSEKKGQYGFLIGSFLFLGALHVGLEGFGFRLNRSDIIILILSNVALVGALFWMVSKDNTMYRVLFILGIIALKLGATVSESWVSQLWTFDSVNWLFRVSFLEYMVIVLAGSIVGDLLLASIKKQDNKVQSTSRAESIGTLLILFLMVSLSLVGMFARWGIATLIIQLALIFGLFIIKRKNLTEKEISLLSGTFLVIGMLMEPFEGGVKKDPTTISYLFISSGLSGFILLFCMDILKVFPRKFLTWLIESGQNPMVAYVLPAIFIVPVFGILGIDEWMAYLNANEWTGFLKGLIYTVLAMIITSMLTRRRFLLKT